MLGKLQLLLQLHRGRTVLIGLRLQGRRICFKLLQSVAVLLNILRLHVERLPQRSRFIALHRRLVRRSGK